MTTAADRIALMPAKQLLIRCPWRTESATNGLTDRDPEGVVQASISRKGQRVDKKECYLFPTIGVLQRSVSLTRSFQFYISDLRNARRRTKISQSPQGTYAQECEY